VAFAAYLSAQPVGSLPVPLALRANVYPVATHVPHADAENARLPTLVPKFEHRAHVPTAASPVVCT
jgi:hypothetical protein